MQPFIAPKGASSKDALIALRKKQALEAAEALKNGAGSNSTAIARAKAYIPPEDAAEKLRIIFDNSGSMGGGRMKQAKEGVVEFLRNCSPQNTAVALHLLNNESDSDYDSETNAYIKLALPSNVKNQTLTTDLILLASETMHPTIDATGGTPLYETLLTALNAEPRATRLIAFTDGAAAYSSDKSKVFSTAKRIKVPIDTVYISGDGYENPSAISCLEEIARETGGIFLNLAKGDFAKSLRYLAPTQRLMLADASFKGKVERGEI
jgi:Mg-chelatase subunit ChlD